MHAKDGSVRKQLRQFRHGMGHVLGIAARGDDGLGPGVDANRDRAAGEGSGSPLGVKDPPLADRLECGLRAGSGAEGRCFRVGVIETIEEPGKPLRFANG